MYLPPKTLKLVYELRTDLRNDPEMVQLAQALTLDAGRPQIGLRGDGGLFGSDEWWASTLNGRLRRADASGVITRTWFAGQDARWGDEVNTFEARLADGSTRTQGILVNNQRDAGLFRPGHRVAWAAVLDAMKNPSHGDVVEDGVGYLTTILEMAVSLKPDVSPGA